MGKKKQAKREAKRGAKQLVDADIDVGHGVAAELHRHPVVKAAGALSEVADQPPMVAINLTTIAVGVIAQDRRLTRTGIRMLAAHGLATLVKAAIKHRIDRARPNQFSDREDHRPTPGDRDEGPQNSFPSGHTAGAIAVARAVAREYPGAAVPVQGAAVAIAAIQVPRGTHFPIDVAVGAVIGWAAEAIVARVMPAEQGAGRPSGRIPAQAGARLTEG